MNRCTLIIDGNWLLMSRFFVMSQYFKADNDDEIKQQGVDKLVEMLSQSTSIILRQFRDVVDNIILVTDNKSWRKTLDKPEHLTHIDYKGNRTEDETLDMSRVFDSLNIFKENINKLGVMTPNNTGAEGDDQCWYWSSKLNEQGTNVILWTIDEDMQQLVAKHPTTGAFTGWYNKNKLILHKDLDDSSMSMEDMFMIQEYTNYTLDSISKISEIDIKYINPAYIVAKKILTGDSGDNIAPIFTSTKDGSTRIFKGTEKDYLKINPNIWDNIYEGISNDDNMIDMLDSIYKSIVANKKNLGKYTKLDEFKNHFNYNTSLVWLNRNTIPEEIINEMSTLEYSVINKDTLSNMTMNYKYMMRGEESINALANLFDSIDDTPF